MKYTHKTKALLVVVVALAAAASTVLGQQVECTGKADRVTALTNPNGHLITTKFQFDTPNLQNLLITRINTTGPSTCVVAHLSGLARITDNYVVFQVRIDGVPMNGHTFLPGVDTPIVFRTIDANTEFQDEQFIDPTKVVSYNFFAEVPAGIHSVQVRGAAGSNILPGLEPTLQAFVLTIEY